MFTYIYVSVGYQIDETYTYMLFNDLSRSMSQGLTIEKTEPGEKQSE